ncbi:uncharacterized protein LOC115014387 [Cottoperca gobio]|uniref:Uncharacterized protein LOC115014387 n=1 Tax=Cottoperca gobio TaxID=56716 RepID=A0A6J2QHY6_COTGO|nr:uncharacterized protein LOC115014387 [Cottoperca gobio]
MEEEGEALCRRMICRVRNKQQQPCFSEEERRRHKGARRGEKTACERQVVSGHESRDHRERNLPDCTTRQGDQTSPNYLMCQGPEIQTVPPQLISMLRLKTFKEDMRRAAEVELHDPAVCNVCEQEQASLALKSFIWRKKTQLQFQTLKGRLNTHLSYGECAKSPKALQCPSLDFGRNYLVEMCGSQQPGVALATAKERGVALATDEMRGYPDKNAAESHLARPGCAFSDR